MRRLIRHRLLFRLCTSWRGHQQQTLARTTTTTSSKSKSIIRNGAMVKSIEDEDTLSFHFYPLLWFSFPLHHQFTRTRYPRQTHIKHAIDTSSAGLDALLSLFPCPRLMRVPPSAVYPDIRARAASRSRTTHTPLYLLMNAG